AAAAATEVASTTIKPSNQVQQQLMDTDQFYHQYLFPPPMPAKAPASTAAPTTTPLELPTVCPHRNVVCRRFLTTMNPSNLFLSSSFIPLISTNRRPRPNLGLGCSHRRGHAR